MKKNLLIERMMIVALAGCALTACSKREEPSTDIPANMKHSGEIMATDQDGFRISKHCIDDISYLVYGTKMLVVQRDKNDKPVTCVQPAEPSVR